MSQTTAATAATTAVNNSANVGIKNDWSLIAFARKYGAMKRKQFVNKETGEEFISCAFVNKDKKVTLIDPETLEVTTDKEKGKEAFVHFSRNLGVLTPQEIAAQKDDLQVVQLNSGNFVLCAKGESSWEDVDLGL